MVIPFTFDYLINANLYMGYNSTFRHQTMLSYVRTVKCHTDIINLTYTFFTLRIIFNFFSKLYFNFSFFWLNLYIENIVESLFFRKNKIFSLFKRLFLKSIVARKWSSKCFLLFSKWNYGFITNYKKIKKHWRKRIRLNLLYNVRLVFPQAIIFLSLNKPKRNPIPYINVVDTSTNLKRSLYIIPANQKSFKSSLFFVRIFIKNIIILSRLFRVSFKANLINVLSS